MIYLRTIFFLIPRDVSVYNTIVSYRRTAILYPRTAANNIKSWYS